MKSPWGWIALALAPALSSCSPFEVIPLGGQHQGGEPLVAADAGSTGAADAGGAAVDGGVPCQLQKLAFTQSTGCLNDGSVEFCLPQGNAPLEALVKSLAPSVTASGGGGRAGCNLQTETLFLYPTPGLSAATCTAYHGALTSAAWQEICSLAALKEVRAIVPTWVE